MEADSQALVEVKPLLPQAPRSSTAIIADRDPTQNLEPEYVALISCTVNIDSLISMFLFLAPNHLCKPT
jgi:hypothetical protein